MLFRSTAGHKAGAETFRRIATYCKNIGVQYLTVYAFSTENWKRSEAEVSAIMALLKRYLLEAEIGRASCREREIVKKYIYEHFGEDISVESLSKMVYMAPSYGFLLLRQ